LGGIFGLPPLKSFDTWPCGVEALTIGAVLGFSFIVWLGLMTVAA
jgi:hypothetical protein